MFIKPTLITDEDVDTQSDREVERTADSPENNNNSNLSLITLSNQQKLPELHLPEVTSIALSETQPLIIPGIKKKTKSFFTGKRIRKSVLQYSLATVMILIVIAGMLSVVPLDSAARSFNAFSYLASLENFNPQPAHPYVLYSVKAGDTLEGIAAKFNVQTAGILILNKFTSSDQIKIGDIIKIPTDKNYGRQQAQQVSAVYNPPASQTSPSGNVYGSNPWNTLAADKTDSGICGTGSYINPNPGGMYMRGFTWYHNGVDTSGPSGEPILAADSGQVIFAGWDPSGLGWSVKINDCNGVSTIYGHFLKPAMVHTGDNVTIGEQIAQEGSTGNSTGPHLHFTFEINNTPVNPYCYDRNEPPGGSC